MSRVSDGTRRITLLTAFAFTVTVTVAFLDLFFLDVAVIFTFPARIPSTCPSEVTAAIFRLLLFHFTFSLAFSRIVNPLATKREPVIFRAPAVAECSAAKAAGIAAAAAEKNTSSIRAIVRILRFIEQLFPSSVSLPESSWLPAYYIRKRKGTQRIPVSNKGGIWYYL